MAKIKGITVEIGGNTKGLSDAIKKVNNDSKKLQKELKGVNSLLKGDPSNTVLLKQKQDLLTRSVEQTKEKLQMLKSKQEEVKKAFDSNKITEAQYRDFQREIVKTEQDLKRLTREQKNFNKAGLDVKSVSEKLKGVGGKLQDLGKKFAPVSAGAMAVAGTSVYMASKFEDSLAKVMTIADSSEMGMDKMKKAILDMSNQTGKSATEIAESVYQCISAGQKTGDAVKYVGSATKLAKAGFTETGQALDILTTITNAYGMSAKDVTKISDILLNTQNHGKVVVGELAQYMGKIIPTAKASGVSLEQLASGYAVMTRNGTNARFATTQMNALIDELGKHGSKTSDILKNKTGKSFQELMKSGKSLGDVLQILKDEAQQSGLQLTDLFSSSEAGKGALALLTEGASGFNKELESMSSAGGATSKALDNLKTNGGKVRKAINQMKNASIELGGSLAELLAPVLDKVVKLVKNMTQWFSNLSEPTKRVIAGIVGITAVISPLLIGVGGIVRAVGALLPMIAPLVSGLVSLGTTLVALTGPWGAIALGIGAVITALVAFGGSSEENLSKAEKREKALQEEIHKTAEAYSKREEASKKAMENSDAEVAIVERLVAKLSEYVDENGKVQEGKEKAVEFILNDLQQATGMEITMQDGVIQKYGELGASIDSIMEKKRAQIYMEANEEGYKEAILHIDEHIEAMDRKKAKMDEVKQKLIECTDSSGMMQMELSSQLQEYEKSYNEARDTVITDLTHMETQEEAYKAFADGNYGEVRNILAKNKDAIRELTKCNEDELIKQKNDTQSKLADIKEKRRSHDSQILRDEQTAAEARLGIINNELQRRGISENQGKEKSISNARQASDGVASELKKTESRARSAGQSAGSGFASGIWDRLGDVKQAAINMAERASNWLKNHLKINSPSKVFMAIGHAVPEGFAVGIKKQTKQVVGAVKSMANEAVKVGLPDANVFGIMEHKVNLGNERAESRKLEEVIGLLKDNLPKITKEQNIVLNDGTLVGKTANKIDLALGKNRMVAERGMV